ncbi:MAG: glycerophosphodiester phosphodiesterase [Lentisphaerae bacterium]|nr:glycerophosphodiester phosphodiesterase [Lentisphaerota bacterium]
MQFEPGKVYWQAHRGGGGKEAPDNTIYAMKYGWSLGGIPEADIRVTSDNVVVCLHDNTLARTTDAPPELADELIGNLPFEVVKKYDASRKFAEEYAGEHVPALSEVFELMQLDRSRMLYADIKNYDAKFFPILLEGFAALTEKYQTAPQIIVAGCDYELNCRIKREIPGIKTMQWIGFAPDKRMEKFLELAAKDFAGLDLVQLHLYEAASPEADWMYDLPLGDIRRAFEILGERLEVFTFGNFTEAAIKTLLDIGIRQFATDEPQRFSQILNKLQTA